ncbi:transcription factor of the MADS box [Apophysomyces sp. BC1034]|nr:transcription factor of the MADS box [Apophysomyces sp. BC1015]KAG0180200.1 transcription factor of the MADS box [Apophysomyces sp. BC1021]KAG0190742.1 transcription factor of the MADS box [Apophysomyces sp. BC1034]
MNPSQLNPDLGEPSRPTPSVETMKKAGKKHMDDEENDSGDDSESEKPSRRSGRRKIKIEYIEDKNRRHITFSKRKAGIMKKAYELSTLTGTQVLLLVVSETGLVYTFTTVKLQIVTKPEGKNLIQACLNAPDPIPGESSSVSDAAYNNNGGSPRVDDKKAYEEKKDTTPTQPPAPASTQYGGGSSAAGYQPQAYATTHQQVAAQQQAAAAAAAAAPGQPMSNVNNSYGHPGYMNAAAQYQQPQQQSQQPYGQMPQPFYGNQQAPPHHYMPHQQAHPGYWPQTSNAGPPAGSNAIPRQEHSPADDKARRGVVKK